MGKHFPNACLQLTVKRVDPCGWDAEDRAYFLFDDDRLYRQTDPPLPSSPSKKGKAPKSGRSSKRQRLSRVIPDTSPEDSGADTKPNGAEPFALAHEDNFAGRRWECVAITLEDYNKFLDSIRRSRNADEKNLFRFVSDEVIPSLSHREEERQRKEMRKLRELENQQKLATAKRSSRLASKFEKKREQDEAEEAERKKHADIEMAHRELARQHRMEEVRRLALLRSANAGQDRESRMMTREQRIREREMKRILHEEELAKEQDMLKRLAEQGTVAQSASAKSRVSRRQLDADMVHHKTELEKLQVEDDWMFDCSVCGVHGQNWVRRPVWVWPWSNVCRTTARIASRASSAALGSTARATASRSTKPRRRSSTLCVGRASSRRRTPARPMSASQCPSRCPSWYPTRQSNRSESVAGRERFLCQRQPRWCQRLAARRRRSWSTISTTWVLRAAASSAESSPHRRRRPDRLWHTRRLSSRHRWPRPSRLTTKLRRNPTSPRHPRRLLRMTILPTTLSPRPRRLPAAAVPTSAVLPSQPMA